MVKCGAVILFGASGALPPLEASHALKFVSINTFGEEEKKSGVVCNSRDLVHLLLCVSEISREPHTSKQTDRLTFGGQSS